MIKIEKIFHRYWTGDEMPDIFKYYGKTWIREHPDWELKLWTDDNLPDLRNQDLFDKEKVASVKSDLVRYEMVYRYGGIYIDTDFECYKNLEPLIDELECFGSGEAQHIISGGFFGAKSGNPLVLDIIVKLGKNLYENGHLAPNVSAGPIFLTEAIKTSPYRDLFFKLPKKLFYPVDYPVDVGPNKCVDYPYAYANHHWAASWLKK